MPGRATVAGRVEVAGSKVLGRGEKNPSICSVETGCCQPSVIERQLARRRDCGGPFCAPENEWILQCSPPFPVEPKVIPPKSSSVAVNHAVAGDASVSVHVRVRAPPMARPGKWGPSAGPLVSRSLSAARPARSGRGQGCAASRRWWVRPACPSALRLARRESRPPSPGTRRSIPRLPACLVPLPEAEPTMRARLPTATTGCADEHAIVMTPDGSGPSDAPGGEADGNRLVSPQEGAGNLPTWRKPKRLPGHAGVGGDEQARADGDQASACRPEIDPRDPTRNGVQESMPARTTVDGSHELTVGNRESHLVANEVEIACRRGHPSRFSIQERPPSLEVMSPSPAATARRGPATSIVETASPSDHDACNEPEMEADSRAPSAASVPSAHGDDKAGTLDETVTGRGE